MPFHELAEALTSAEAYVVVAQRKLSQPEASDYLREAMKQLKRAELALQRLRAQMAEKERKQDRKDYVLLK